LPMGYHELMVVSTTGSAVGPPIRIDSAATTGGHIEYGAKWSSDGSIVGYPETDPAPPVSWLGRQLYTVSMSGPTPGPAIHTSGFNIDGGNLGPSGPGYSSFWFSADSTLVAYGADESEMGQPELYLVNMATPSDSSGIFQPPATWHLGWNFEVS